MKTTRREMIQMLGVAAGTAVICPLISRGTSVAKEPSKPVDFPWKESLFGKKTNESIQLKIISVA
jgi:hypothetical protein